MTSKKNLLLVEDEAVIALDEAQALRNHGFEVFTAFNGQEAVDLARTVPDLDLVLMDIDLGPGMDGTEAARLILQSREVPVLFLSSHTEPEVIEKTEEVTSYGYVVKNSGITVLLASMKMAFRLFSANRELKKKEESLRESEEIFRLFMEHSPIYVFFKDDQIRSLRLSKNYETMLGRPLEELLGKTMNDLFPSDLAKAMVQDDLRLLQEGKAIRVTEELGERVYETVKFPIRQGNKPSYLAGFTIDVTEAKRTEKNLARAVEGKTLLLKELQHRVKNNMSLISGLIGIEKMQATAPETLTVLENLTHRIETMTELYSLLSQEEDLQRIRLDVYLANLIRSQAAARKESAGPRRLRESLETVTIDTKRSTSVGLILNELLTNVYKHAFPDDREGEVRIVLTRERGDAVLEVRNNGEELPEGFTAETNPGLGLKLVLALTEQLGGSFDVSREQGTVFRLRFPLEA